MQGDDWADWLLCGQDLTTDLVIPAANGRTQLAVDVFAHSLTFMKKHLLRAVGAHLGYDPHPDTVRWVLTVPAIWDENAKQFMREAAYRVRTKILSACLFYQSLYNTWTLISLSHSH